jgi:hypothetical protein
VISIFMTPIGCDPWVMHASCYAYWHIAQILFACWVDRACIMHDACCHVGAVSAFDLFSFDCYAVWLSPQ